MTAPTAPLGAGERLPRLEHPASEAVEGARGSPTPRCSLLGSGPAAGAPWLGAQAGAGARGRRSGAGLTGPRASLSCSCRSCCPRSSTASSVGSGCGGSATCAGRASSAASPSLACPLPASRKCRLRRARLRPVCWVRGRCLARASSISRRAWLRLRVQSCSVVTFAPPPEGVAALLCVCK